MSELIPLDGSISVSAGHIEGSPVVIIHLPDSKAKKAAALPIPGAFDLVRGILSAIVKVGNVDERELALSALGELN